MAIRTIVTRGFGNSTFAGTIPLVVTRGYTIGAAVAVVPGPYYVAALQILQSGSVASEIYQPGSVVSQIHVPGAVAVQGELP